MIFAADWYRSYIPMFLFCLFKAYPDYEAVIFLRKPLGHVEKPGLKLIEGMGKWYTIEVDGFPKLQDRAGRVRLFQCGRFLVLTPEIVESLAEYDYIYLTDVDILIMPEKIPLHEQHIRHMKVLGLPYSNFIRNTTPSRLTGLHFAGFDFYRKVAPVVEQYANMIKATGIPRGYGRCADEELWYRIVQESGLALPPKCPYSEKETWERVFDPAGCKNVWFGPHHGMHVGFGRAMKRFRPIFDLPFYKQYLYSLKRLRNEDDRFDKLCDILHPRARDAMKAVLSMPRI